MTTEQELHDRATRGLPLTDTEQVQLDEWYAQQDAAENRLLNSSERSQTQEVLQAQNQSGTLTSGADDPTYSGVDASE